jgi:hypothetical protein
MEGPVEFLEGIATSKGLATLTLDKDYQNARIQRKEIQSQTTPEIVSSGKNAIKVCFLF